MHQSFKPFLNILDIILLEQNMRPLGAVIYLSEHESEI